MEGVIVLLFANGDIRYPKFSKTYVDSAIHKIYLDKICILSYGKVKTLSVFSSSCGIDIFGDSAILRCVGDEFHPFASTEEDAKNTMRKWIHLATCAQSMSENNEIKYRLDLPTENLWFADRENFFTGILDLTNKKYTTYVEISGIKHCIVDNFSVKNVSTIEKIKAIRLVVIGYLGKKIIDPKFQDWCNFCSHISTIKKLVDNIVSENFQEEITKVKGMVSKFSPAIFINEDRYYCIINNMKIYYDPQNIKISFGERIFYNLSKCSGKSYTDKIISALMWISNFCDLNIKNGNYLNPECGKIEVTESEIKYL